MYMKHKHKTYVQYIKVYYITAKHKLFIFIITDMLHDKQTLIIPEFVYKCNDKISQHPQDSFI